VTAISRLRFVTADVFAGKVWAGNPLAVVFDPGRRLDAASMQAIAREFNLSETVILTPPAEPGRAAAGLRIFTPLTEVPFAGHPTIGTAYILATEPGAAALSQPIGLETAAGLVEAGILTEGGAPVGARIRAPGPFTLEDGPAPRLVAQALGLEAADLSLAHHAPVVASMGLPFLVVELANSAALARLAASRASVEGVLPSHGADGIFAYVRPTDGAVTARMLSPLDGIGEDPATGSAAAALGALLLHLDGAAECVLDFGIVQGVEIGRPSRIEVAARKSGGRIAEVRVAGRCVRVMEGTLALPG
jgi:trans-2,3-dihydro-3-hydroxyanthranilate isomerase